MEILLVEDEPKVADFIKRGLEEKGFTVTVAFDGQTGESLAKSNEYDVIIMDVIMPFVNGIELCKRIRLRKIDTPVLMLTALSTTEDKLTGFDAGADDYLIKPFEFSELLARIGALTKRGKVIPRAGNVLIAGDLELDTERKIARRGETIIELTSKEYQLLEYLIRNKGRVLSRVDIAEKVWEVNFDTGTNVVDVYINILRKKIDKNFEHKLIHTRIGMGYILED
ncbi:MAG: response regulator transcription factor [Bacteroidales bacterium]|nr:response regulator transcription factor [Bacteroidales bacterium]MCB8998856.1 response regulator transcription factor [Bacteroidales bacterium]MCB9014005.1 response regulator transcription factor [Bacteroidales bacterium]